MQPIAFCTRCRGMRVGWNGRYILHRLRCKTWIPTSSKLLILTVVLSIFVLRFPTPSAFLLSVADSAGPGVQQASFQVPTILAPVLPAVDPLVHTIDAFLQKYHVDASQRGRVAKSVVASARKHDLDPKLIASIMMVESRANPLAVSSSEAVGLMQIHLPTWGQVAEREGINLFKVEDNIDLGVRILKDYIRRFGTWEGVKRYKGWNPDSPESTQAADEYLTKVQHIYAFQQPPTPELLQ